jgi:hypothetical protein
MRTAVHRGRAKSLSMLAHVTPHGPPAVAWLWRGRQARGYNTPRHFESKTSLNTYNCNAVGSSNLSELKYNNLHDLEHADFASNCIVTAELSEAERSRRT